MFAHGRMFAPAIGISEDPVTGNANGPLGAYLVEHGLFEPSGGSLTFRARQGEALGRPGIVEVTVDVEGRSREDSSGRRPGRDRVPHRDRRVNERPDRERGSGPSFSVHPARSDDVAVLVELNRFAQQLHAEARPDVFHDADAMLSPRGYFERLVADRAQRLLLVEVSGHPVGYVHFETQRRSATPFKRPGARLYVHQLCVHPQHRRSGVGGALLNQVFTEARQLGIGVVALDVWAFNADARAFLERLGFRAYNMRLERRWERRGES